MKTKYLRAEGNSAYVGSDNNLEVGSSLRNPGEEVTVGETVRDNDFLKTYMPMFIQEFAVKKWKSILRNG